MTLQAESLGQEHVMAQHGAVRALGRQLDQIADLLLVLDGATYCVTFDSLGSGSIGAHVRHCLDHVGSLLAADPTMTLTYDRRDRGTPLETDPGAALHQLLRHRAALDGWSNRLLDQPVAVITQLSTTGETVTTWSTLARELTFVLSHTIHHQALIGVLAALHGAAVPDRFGYAPSTPQRH
jgi:hypothetical protein